jgi:AAA domain
MTDADEFQKWPDGPGLYAEVGPVEAHLLGLLDPADGDPLPHEGKTLFKALPEDVFNVERWVRDTLGDWGYPAPHTTDLDLLVGDLKKAQTRSPSTIKRVKFDPLRARPAEWLWNDRIYLGGFNVLLGREGVGKGTMAAWMISQLALGRLPGQFEGLRTTTAIIGSEDNFHHEWGPRIVAAMLESGVGLDEATRVLEGHVTQYELPSGGVPGLADVREIAGAVQEDDVKLVYFDSLLDSLSGGVDVWKDKSTRDALLPAKWLAEELGAAVVGSLHPNKRGETFDQIVSGARSFNAVSRSSLLLEQHPAEEDVRVVLRGKGNYSAAPPAMEWTLVGKEFEMNDLTFNKPTVHDMQESDVSEEDLMKRFSSEKGGDREPTKAEQATDHLLTVLADGKPHQSEPILEELYEAGLGAKNVVQKAKKNAKVRSFREGVGWWMQIVSEDTE